MEYGVNIDLSATFNIALAHQPCFLALARDLTLPSPGVQASPPGAAGLAGVPPAMTLFSPLQSTAMSAHCSNKSHPHTGMGAAGRVAPGDEGKPSGFSLIFLLKANLHCMRVCSQPLELRKPHARLAQHLEVAAIEAQAAGPLQKSVDPARRTEPRGSGGPHPGIPAGAGIAEPHRRRTPSNH